MKSAGERGKREEGEKKTNGDETHRLQRGRIRNGDFELMLLDSTGRENDAYLREEVGDK